MAAISQVLSGMSDDTLSNLKNDKLAIELIYSKEQDFDYQYQNFKYTKLFFPLQTREKQGLKIYSIMQPVINILSP